MMTASSMRRTITVLVAALAAAGFAGCAEKEPRALPSREGAAYNNQKNGESLLRERTMNQGATDRINN